MKTNALSPDRPPPIDAPLPGRLLFGIVWSGIAFLLGSAGSVICVAAGCVFRSGRQLTWADLPVVLTESGLFFLAGAVVFYACRPLHKHLFGVLFAGLIAVLPAFAFKRASGFELTGRGTVVDAVFFLVVGVALALSQWNYDRSRLGQLRA